MYYRNTSDKSVQMLMEVLEMEAVKKQNWTMKHIISICEEIDFIVDEPEHADYSDSTYLVLAELFSDFKKFGYFINVPERLKSVKSFMLDETSKQKILSALNDLKRGTIGNGKTRVLITAWEKDGTLSTWQQHINNLIIDIASTPIEEELFNSNEVSPVPNKKPRNLQKKRKECKKMTVLFWILSLLFTGFSFYIILYGAGVTYNSMHLRISGIKTTAEVVDIVGEMRPRKTDSIKERTEYTYFEIVSFTAENGDKIQSQLYGKGESEERYSIGEQIEIYYNPQNPNQIVDAGSNSETVKGIVAVIFGLFIFLVITSLSKGLFSSLGTIGGVISITTKLLLFLFIFGLLFKKVQMGNQ